MTEKARVGIARVYTNQPSFGCDRLRGGMGKLVVRADHEMLEGVTRVQAHGFGATWIDGSRRLFIATVLESLTGVVDPVLDGIRIDTILVGRGRVRDQAELAWLTEFTLERILQAS